MMGNYGQYMIVYVAGFILMGFLLIRSFVVKDKNLMNVPGIEKDKKKFGKVRILYTITQAVCLFLFVMCFIYFKNFYVAIAAFFIGVLFPICASLLYDTYLIRQQMGEKEE